MCRALAGTDCRPLLLRQQASRPQLKRGPLGGCETNSMANPMALRRYWFTVPSHLGIGVTAGSRSEAEALARDAARRLGWPFEGTACTEDVDVRTLDQHHAVPNMGPPSIVGVWYPRLNL